MFRSGIDGSGERLVLRGVAKRGFVVTDDRIYYFHQDADASVSLLAFVLHSRKDTPIAHIVEPVFLRLGLSPDRRYLVSFREACVPQEKAVLLRAVRFRGRLIVNQKGRPPVPEAIAHCSTSWINFAAPNGNARVQKGTRLGNQISSPGVQTRWRGP